MVEEIIRLIGQIDNEVFLEYVYILVKELAE